MGSQELSPASGLAFISLPWPLCAVAVTRGPVFGLRMESQGAAALDRQASSRYFAALDSSVGDLRQRAQSLIDRLNDSRKEDHTVMSSFRDSLQLKVRAVLGGGGGGSVRLMRLIALFQPNYPWCRGAVRGGAAGKQPPAAEPGACLHRLRQRGAPRPLRGGCSCLQLCFREQKGRRRPPPSSPSPRCCRPCSFGHAPRWTSLLPAIPAARGWRQQMGGGGASECLRPSWAQMAAGPGQLRLGGTLRSVAPATAGAAGSKAGQAGPGAAPALGCSCRSPPPPLRGRHRLCPRCCLPSCPRHPVCFSPFPKVSNLAEQLEERLFQLYSLHNELIQERLQELAEVMERVRQAEDELQQVCHTVEAAYRDLCLQPET